MCGGWAPVRYGEPKQLPGWDTFWKGLKEANARDIAVFVELAQGCNDMTCAYQCQARGASAQIMSTWDANRICDLLSGFRWPVLLYGMGNPLHFPIEEFAKGARARWRISHAEITVTPNVSTAVVKALGCIKKNVRVQTVMDAIQVNLRRSEFDRVIIPVAKHVGWLEAFLIVRVSKLPVIFRSLTPSWDERYIGAEMFTKSLRNIGIAIEVEERKIGAGFKPVIESFTPDQVLTMRRCFQPNSRRYKFHVGAKSNVQDGISSIAAWRKDDKAASNRLKEMLEDKPDCRQCTDVGWSYYCD